jgi:hypothetical protein
MRPPQGYPSEFQTPGGHYNQLKDTMKKLQYTPIPQSELYPGQFKRLKRVQNYTSFYKGAALAVKVGCAGVIFYSVFFHRWEGENVFSKYFRFRQGLQSILFDVHEDTTMKRPTMRLGTGELTTSVDESIGLERPMKKHLLEAERRKQLQELER